VQIKRLESTANSFDEMMREKQIKFYWASDNVPTKWSTSEEVQGAHFKIFRANEGGY
jgi:hypothetical protein